jgi:hypothetical protein
VRLTIVIVVLLTGCSRETEIQKCDRLRLAATAAVTAYVDARRPEEKRLEDATADLDKRYKASLEARDRLRDALDAIACGHVVGFATRRQPERSAAAELHLRGEPALTAARLASADVGDSLGALTIATDALQAALAGWGPTIDAAPSRPGKPWSAKQRTFLEKLEQEWCALERVMTPVIEAKMDLLKGERDKLEVELDSTRKQYFAYLDASTPGHDVSRELRAGLREVRVYPKLHDDPAFAPSEDAIKSYNRCRE